MAMKDLREFSGAARCCNILEAVACLLTYMGMIPSIADFFVCYKRCNSFYFWDI